MGETAKLIASDEGANHQARWDEREEKTFINGYRQHVLQLTCTKYCVNSVPMITKKFTWRSLKMSIKK